MGTVENRLASEGVSAMPRYAILGANGQLGRDLCPRLSGEVHALTREQADLAKPSELRTFLSNLRPDIVVNCAAYNFVDRAEAEPAAAFAVNAWGVCDLAAICRDLNCTLVQFSTDYVFGLDQTRRTPWCEADAPGPVSVYGLSKLSGEYVVRSVCPKHFVIRTCGLYGVWGSGGKGGNFVETMLRLAGQGKPLRIVADQTCTPSYSVDVAEAAIALLNTDHYGLYHVTNSGSCTWHELASTIFALSGLNVQPTAITSAEFGAAARRPSYSVLAAGAYHSLGLKPMRPWRDALAAYLDERQRKSGAMLAAQKQN
jgi:dTDP-4-dehydrorhamnose reductase